MSTNNYTTLNMSEINAYRMDGLGNDFIIVDRRENSINLSKEKIIKLGDRKVLGFDQILFIEKLENDSYPIKIYNSDGGEVSACGNGARCVAYLLGKNLNIKEIKLKTKNIEPSNITLKIDDKLFTGGFCVNIGNPHIVFFVADCFEHDLNEIGPKIENHDLFPEKVNVTFAQIIDKSNIKVNVWERGAGLTKACGTAACATAVAALENKLINNKVNIKFNEGILKIEIDKNHNIFMTGPVSEIKNIKIEI